MAFSLPSNVEIYLDNEGVINRVEVQLKYPFDYSFSILDLDWDVIAQFSEPIHLLNDMVKSNHVNGRQNKNLPYEELDLNSQTNVNVDDIVGLY
eukprot:1142044-Ditylum_brightwellii.AAC.1